ncbi:L-dopachrome tautomerase-related protein [Sphingomonas phyllosphaerae]|uniref:L-dopachrome tautomerase-related protein n=1 Tax=Sphingomonas phyllosphaerae TaxID=257003 RepID=UPI003D6A0351
MQSVVADDRGNLWVADSAAPGQSYVVPGGAKLVRFDLATDRVAQVIHFDENVAPPSSYINDVRLGADGRHA